MLYTGSVTTAFVDDGPSGWCSGRDGRLPLSPMLTTLHQTLPMQFNVDQRHFLLFSRVFCN